MSKTMQGAFDTTYHHIDAPTVQDEEYRKKYGKRRLMPPLVGDTDCYRSEILAYLAESDWVYSRKIDGANLRVQWDGEQVLWNGKTNAFQCGAELTEYMNNTFIEEIFEEKFGREKQVLLFGEHMGPKVQGNELGLEKDEFILYDVCINGTWLKGVDVVEVAHYFGVRPIWALMPSGQAPAPLRVLINRVAHGDFKDWEGIVAHPLTELRDQKGRRVIVKIKNKDYSRSPVF